MRSKTGLWEAIGSLSKVDAISIALGGPVFMIVMWYLGAGLWTYFGPPPGREGTWRWAWFIPYPDPFTWRSGVAVALIFGPSLAMYILWVFARRSYRRDHITAD